MVKCKWWLLLSFVHHTPHSFFNFYYYKFITTEYYYYDDEWRWLLWWNYNNNNNLIIIILCITLRRKGEEEVHALGWQRCVGLRTAVSLFASTLSGSFSLPLLFLWKNIGRNICGFETRGLRKKREVEIKGSWSHCWLGRRFIHTIVPTARTCNKNILSL